MKINFKKILCRSAYWLSILAAVVFISILMNGVGLFDLPKQKDVEKVEISYTALSEESKIFDDERNIELAVSLANFLKYVPFKTADSEEKPLITITYYLKDGKKKEVSANNDIVWYNGKTHLLKDDEIFINLTEGIFFLQEAESKKSPT